MFSRICILIFPLLVLSRSILISNATLDLDARDASPVEWFTEPWCIYHLDAFTDHWAIMIPDDGSKEEDGFDKAGHCGKKFKNHAVGGGITPTEWYVLTSYLAKTGAALDNLSTDDYTYRDRDVHLNTSWLGAVAQVVSAVGNGLSSRTHIADTCFY